MKLKRVKLLLMSAVLVALAAAAVTFFTRETPERLEDYWELAEEELSSVTIGDYIYTADGYATDDYNDWGYNRFEIRRENVKTGEDELLIEDFPAGAVYLIPGKGRIYIIQEDGPRTTIWRMECDKDAALELLYYDKLPLSRYYEDTYEGVCSVAVNGSCIYLINSTEVYGFDTASEKMERIRYSRMADEAVLSCRAKAVYSDGAVYLTPDYEDGTLKIGLYDE